jgi:hypothetical protein
VLNAIAVSHGPGPIDAHTDWAQRRYAEIEPSLNGSTYINFRSAEGEERSGPPTGRDAARTDRAFEDFLATIEGA